MKVFMLMGGKSSRFINNGYSIEKNFLPMPLKREGTESLMVLSTLKDLPIADNDSVNWTIKRSIYEEYPEYVEQLKKYSEQFFILDKVTNGQATSALLAIENSSLDKNEDILVAGCDMGMVLDKKKFNSLKQNADMIVFTYRHQNSILEKPQQHSYITEKKEGLVQDVFIKQAPSSSLINDFAIVSTFWFKNKDVFYHLYESMVENQDKCNDEYYIDTMVKYASVNNLKAYNFCVDFCFDYGTPTGYEDFIKSYKYFKGFYTNLKEGRFL